MKDYKKAEYNYETLLKAYFDCRKNKTTTAQALEFEFEREKNLYKLHEDIINGEYEIGRSICFIVTEPKPREIWAGAFRDRIVHHLIYNAIFDRFVSKFIYDTYSCIPTRGTLAGVKRAEKFARNITQNYSIDAYFMKMDIKNYFVSINKEILYKLIMQHIDTNEEKWLADLIEKVVFHDPRENVFIKSPKSLRKILPAHKSLFTTQGERGLPIGNLTSQFFSNIYLNPLDQYAKHVLKCKNYIRYVDDILIIDKDPGYLNWVYSMINRFLIDNLALELNHKKKNMNLIKRGFDFLGYVIKPNRVHVRVRTIKKCKHIIKEWQNSETRYTKEGLESFRSTMNSYFGMLRHASGYNLRKEFSNNISSLFIMPDGKYEKLKVV